MVAAVLAHIVRTDAVVAAGMIRAAKNAPAANNF